MKVSPIAYYLLAAVCQSSGSSGSAMLAPFFMKAHGYAIASAGIPLVANGMGRICSDLFSGVMASYFSSGALLVGRYNYRPRREHYRLLFSRQHAGLLDRLDRVWT